MTSSSSPVPTEASNNVRRENNKRFKPLENNPEVMSQLVHQLGLSPSLAFHDIYSIDDLDLLAFVPRPVHALLLVFPYNETYQKARLQEDEGIPNYQGSGEAEEVMWFKQTIGNACGMIGLLHSVSNGHARDHIEPNSDLATLLKLALPLKPMARAELLHESEILESAHQTAAAKGDTEPLAADEHVDLHYVCFVKTTDHGFWELDGMRKGPLKRGTLEDNEDVLSEKALQLGVRNYLRREEEAGAKEMRFSLIALAQSIY